jgi:hypothetical protein
MKRVRPATGRKEEVEEEESRKGAMQRARLAAVLAALIPLAAAAPAAARDDLRDEVHPRSPGTPLEIPFRPYACAACVGEKRLPPESAPAEEITILRQPASLVAKSIGVEKDWFVIQSPNFKIFSALEKAKVKLSDSRFIRFDLARLKEIFPTLAIEAQAVVLNPHQRAHLYHIRAERIYAHFAALTGNSKKHLGMGAPYELYLFEDYATHHRLVDRYMGKSTDKMGVTHHQRETPNFLATSAYADITPAGDWAFSNLVIHSIAHNLADGYNNYSKETWAWFEEGIAHYYERRETPEHNTFCWTEGRAPTMFEKPNWKSTVLSMVRREKDRNLSEWCEKSQPGEMTAEEQGLSWSLVSWLVETEPVRVARMLDKLEEDYTKSPSGTECIEHGFGVSPSVLHQRWREWVLSEYVKK